MVEVWYIVIQWVSSGPGFMAPRVASPSPRTTRRLFCFSKLWTLELNSHSRIEMLLRLFGKKIPPREESEYHNPLAGKVCMTLNYREIWQLTFGSTTEEGI
jgi:hypothetical protein